MHFMKNFHSLCLILSNVIKKFLFYFKKFYFLPAKRVHEEIAHGIPPHPLESKKNETPIITKKDDNLYNYSCARLCIGLLLRNAEDSVKEGDGDRLMSVEFF